MKIVTTKLNYMAGNLLSIKEKARNKMRELWQDTKGDGSFGTLIAIVIAVIIAGLLILALNSFFPTLWSSVTNKITTTLDL